ncbi:MAG TPA: prepilin-type N-terminal cleavage/methylation domain-containing protein [Candidatus Dormibacteraeota bacterium]|nr:prepilin-type N-terminal cleavage/methylation domain-containing protein [Candidatus Dormibacteraeota bacterium]
MERFVNRAQRPGRRSESGFTLIELLVVIAVLAILAAIVIFNVTGVTNRGASSACVTDLKTVQSASDAYKGDKGSYATADGAGGENLDSSKLAPAYVHTWPDDGQTWAIDASGTVTNTCS